MWRMLQQENADDFVLATGETHTIREFCELAFSELGIELEWQGENENAPKRCLWQKRNSFGD